MRYICILLIACLLVQAVPIHADECLTWKLKGGDKAKTDFDSQHWFMVGMGLGLTLGIAGMGIASSLASNSNPIPILELPSNETDRTCYIIGYRDAAQRKSRNEALLGGAVGTVIIVSILLYLSYTWEN